MKRKKQRIYWAGINKFGEIANPVGRGFGQLCIYRRKQTANKHFPISKIRKVTIKEMR